MLEARTGRVLHTTAVGSDPDQLQINPHIERVFVLRRRQEQGPAALGLYLNWCSG
jgi:hypothetical protein